MKSELALYATDSVGNMILNNWHLFSLNAALKDNICILFSAATFSLNIVWYFLGSQYTNLLFLMTLKGVLW